MPSREQSSTITTVSATPSRRTSSKLRRSVCSALYAGMITATLESLYTARAPQPHFAALGGLIVMGFVGPRSFSAFTFSQIARWNSFVGGGAQPSLQAVR